MHAVMNIGYGVAGAVHQILGPDIRLLQRLPALVQMAECPDACSFTQHRGGQALRFVDFDDISGTGLKQGGDCLLVRLVGNHQQRDLFFQLLEYAQGIVSTQVGDLRFGQDHVALMTAEGITKVFVILYAIGAHRMSGIAEHIGDGLGRIGRIVHYQ